jgi:hypothetical protein
MIAMTELQCAKIYSEVEERQMAISEGNHFKLLEMLPIDFVCFVSSVVNNYQSKAE